MCSSWKPLAAIASSLPVHPRNGNRTPDAAIQRVLKRKGSVLIPAFALGRTQEILALLAVLMREGKLKPQPIYIGGLGRVFTEIYDLESHRTHRQHTNLQLHEALNLVVLEKGQAENMKLAADASSSLPPA